MFVIAVSTLLIGVVLVPLLTRHRSRTRGAVTVAPLACAGAIALARHLSVDVTGPLLLATVLATSMILMVIGRLGGRR